MFVDGAAVFMQEMTGDSVNDHHVVVSASFDIFLFQLLIGCMQVGSQGGYLCFGNVDHEVSAAVSTYSAVYLWRDKGVQFLDKLIYFMIVP